jgi:ribosomal protein S18 acetylase RimI-like enzyme/predicted nucleic acid-binding protein
MTTDIDIQEIDQDSPYLEQVIALGDAHSNTLGFLPREAFKKHARERHILIAVGEDQQLAGYLLYRVSSRHYRASIVHLCIDPKKRRSGIAKKLVEILHEKTKHLSGIRLSCRRDYDTANKLWPELGFVYLFEKPGRGKDGEKLFIWWLDYNNRLLFSPVEEFPTTKIRVAMDANIFLDLQAGEERVDAKESHALLADWLQEEIELCITEELKIEINRNPNEQQRTANLAYANNFILLTSNQNEFDDASEKLQRFLPENKTENDRSDRRQLARTIASDVQYFVTRDDKLLRNKEELYETFGLTIIRPSELITRMDELQRESEYQPQRLAGTGLKTRRVQFKEQDGIEQQFQCHDQQESTTDIRRQLRHFLSEPTRYESLITLDENQTPLAIFVYDMYSPDILDIPLFRVRKGSLGATLARFFIFQFLMTASKGQKKWIYVTDSFLDDVIKDALREDAFVYTDDRWTKLILSIADTAKDLAHKLRQIPEPFCSLAATLEDENTVTDTLKILDIERMLWPAKIVDADIPTYMVTIELKWAYRLFDETFAKETLFGAEKELMLNRQNIYYRSAKSSVERGRILWYVTKDERHQWSGGIRACSHIDEVVVGKPEELFRKFRRMGVYTWEDVLQTAKEEDNTIMAIRFSNTESFVQPIPLTQLREIYTEEGTTFQAQGIKRISKDLFARLYRIGKNLMPM